MKLKNICSSEEKKSISCCGDEKNSDEKKSKDKIQDFLPQTNNDNKFINPDFIGIINIKKYEIRKVSTNLTIKDHLGSLKARLNINRNDYKIKPGLYAVGKPDSSSPVLVTANYKLSFDHLRKEINDMNVFILVLDTKGINVWCAAGKGTFGTEELINRINLTGLREIINHKKIIVPQLGAPGISAHVVKKETGLNIIYGPVRSADIIKFFENGKKASDDMRRVKFTMYDRLVLVPVEISLGLKYLFITVLIFLLLSGLSSSGFNTDLILSNGFYSVFLLILAFFSGTFISPLLLPYLPGRAFSFKGFFAGSLTYLILHQFFPGIIGTGIIINLSWFLIIATISSFLSMNFTGASTFTSLSGVKKEMAVAVPMQIIGSVSGLTLWIIGRFI